MYKEEESVSTETSIGEVREVFTFYVMDYPDTLLRNGQVRGDDTGCPPQTSILLHNGIPQWRACSLAQDGHLVPPTVELLD